MSHAQKRPDDATRWDSLEGELAMERGHLPAWDAMIRQMDEHDLSQKRILDFGCNRGGFLRRLYQQKPFARAVGVDIAHDAVADAARLAGSTPVVYATPDALTAEAGSFDVVFSHEVVYLLPDLAAHAADIHRWLKHGGVYYMAIGEYAENPLWPRWKEIVSAFSPVPPQTYSLQDMASVFHRAGFTVGVTRLDCRGFFDYDPTEMRYLHSPYELVRFMTSDMMYFRFQKT